MSIKFFHIANIYNIFYIDSHFYKFEKIISPLDYKYHFINLFKKKKYIYIYGPVLDQTNRGHSTH